MEHLRRQRESEKMIEERDKREEIKKRRLSVYKIVIYCIIFYALWSVRELIIRPVFLDSLRGVGFQIAETLMKLAVWTVPAVILIIYYKDDMWISLKEMLTNKVKWTTYAPIFIAFFLFNFFVAWASSGQRGFNPDFRLITAIEIVLFVGITEEAVFRGWLLNAMLKKMKLWHAVLLNAALFILIHYPYWIYKGYDILTFLSSSVIVLALSIIFSWTFIKSKNIIIPIILHMSWNLFTILFLGS